MTASSHKDLYKYIDVLLRSVPVDIKDMVESELIIHGVSFIGSPRGLMFIALRNKKISVLRGKLKHDPLLNSCDINENTLTDAGFEMADGYHYSVLVAAISRSSAVTRRFVRKLLRNWIVSGELEVQKISKQCGFSDKRGYKLYTDFRRTVREVDAEGKVHGMYRVSSVSDVLRLLRWGA